MAGWVVLLAACGEGGDGVPCEGSAVLSERCAGCHGSSLREGAPLALLVPADFRAERNGRTVAAIALARLRDRQRPMPPATEPPMSAADRAALIKFLKSL